MKILCNRGTKKIEEISRDNFNYNLITHIQLEVNTVLNIENERLNDAEDGLRSITQAEIDIDNTIKLDAQVEAELSNPAIRILAEVFASKFVPPLNAADIIAEAKQRRRDEL
jgi:hypothetical protein